jgi:hypothetical protein
MSEIRTHDPGFQASDDSACLRRLSYRDRQEEYYLRITFSVYMSPDSIVCIANGCGVDDQGVGVRVPVGEKISLPYFVQTDSGAHPVSYPMGTVGILPRR